MRPKMRFKWVGGVLALVLPVAGARADKIDGLVGLNLLLKQQSASIESGSRTGIYVELSRLSKYIGVNLGFNSGGGYTDFGGSLRIFKHIEFSHKTATGLSAGVGVGGYFSNGTISGNSSDPSLVGSDGKARPFVDIVFNPFARYLWDTGHGWGLSGELGLEIVPQRAYPGSETPKSENTLRKRILFALGVVFDI